MTQGALDWTADVSADVNVPVSGSTLAAKHASASGAVVGQVIRGRVVKAILAAFLRHGRLTIADCSTVTGIKIQSVCSCWNALEHRAEWIRGTGEFQVYEVFGRVVKREFHELTTSGREAAERVER